MADAPTAPETGAPPAAPATPATEPAAPAASTEPARLPDDHPLVKAYEATRGELKSLKDAEKTELQRATDDLQSEKTRADGLETELARLRVAVKHGISDTDIGLLGSDPKEFEANAKRIAELAGSQKKSGNHVPREGQPTSAAPSDERAFVRELFSGG